MQEEKQKTALGNQNHGAWVCKKCGWTYPNPHPSAKHRRNHKRHCRKRGDSETTGSLKQDRPSSPDSGEDLPVAHGSADEASDKSLHGSSVAENAGAEAGNGSGRFEEEVFADAATEFSVSLRSRKVGFIELIDSDLSDAESRSAEETLWRGHEYVAIGSGEGKTEQKPVILSVPDAPSRRRTSHESFQTKGCECFVGFAVHSNNGDRESDHRSNGSTCILEPNLVRIDNADAVDNMNKNTQEDVMEAQNHQILDAEEALSQGNTFSPDDAFFVTKWALEVKVTQSVDRSVPAESEIKKTRPERGKGNGTYGYQHQGSKDQDPSSLMSTEEALGNFSSTSSEILDSRIEESVKKAECNANLSRENSVSRDKDVLTPLETLNAGKY